jgi:hypothetical protein
VKGFCGAAKPSPGYEKMRALSAAELLGAWERGHTQPSFRRALILLSVACPELTTDELAQLSIGERDAQLLALRQLTFGSQLVSLANCSACGQQLEVSFGVEEIRAASETGRAKEMQNTSGKEAFTPLSMNLNEYEVLFRLPNSLDLAAIAGSLDAGASQQLLFQRCVLSARLLDEEIDASQLPAEIFETIASRMAEADPQADVQLNLSCLQCGHLWQEAFDIESFFWAELQVWAERLLREVHLLARAYGWREADILAMSPYRRQFYLGMVSG